MNFSHLSVTVPIKVEMGDTLGEVLVWPLVEQALQAVSAQEITFDAARKALLSSHGCAALANYLEVEGESVHKMDYSYKAPLLVLAAQHAEDDDGADVILDDADRMLFLETDDYLFAFSVIKNWQVDWALVADEVTTEYEADTDMEKVWALDHLLEYAEVVIDSYRRPDDDL